MQSLASSNLYVLLSFITCCLSLPIEKPDSLKNETISAVRIADGYTFTELNEIEEWKDFASTLIKNKNNSKLNVQLINLGYAATITSPALLVQFGSNHIKESLICYDTDVITTDFAHLLCKFLNFNTYQRIFAIDETDSRIHEHVEHYVFKRRIVLGKYSNNTCRVLVGVQCSGCLESIQVTTDDFNITSPGFPRNLPDINCWWVLTAQIGVNISIEPLVFNVSNQINGLSADCSGLVDYLQIMSAKVTTNNNNGFDVNVANFPPSTSFSKTICWYGSKNPATFRSDDSVTILHYVTGFDPPPTGYGFVLRVRGTPPLMHEKGDDQNKGMLIGVVILTCILIAMCAMVCLTWGVKQAFVAFFGMLGFSGTRARQLNRKRRSPADSTDLPPQRISSSEMYTPSPVYEQHEDWSSDGFRFESSPRSEPVTPTFSRPYKPATKNVKSSENARSSYVNPYAMRFPKKSPVTKKSRELFG